MESNYIEFGQIVNTHGLNGELKVYPNTNRYEIILKLKKVYIDNNEYTVEKIRIIKNMFGLKLKNIDNIEEATHLLNKEVKRELTIKEIEIASKQNEYFVKDLENMDVYDEHEKYIGKLKEVFETGANDVYRIVKNDGKELLLPAIKQVILDVNLTEKKMKVKILEGLE